MHGPCWQACMHTPGIASVCVCVCVWPNVGVPRRNGTVSSAAALCWTGGLEPVPAVAAPTPVESFALGLRRELPAEARASGGLAPARRPRTWQRTAPAASASGQGAHATSPQHQRLRARLLAACTLHSARMACIRACSAPRGAPQPPLLHAVAMHPQPANANRTQLGLWPPRACMHAPHPLPDHDRYAARPGAAQRGAGAVPGRHQLRVDTPSQVEARLAAGAVIVHHSCLNRVQRAVRAIPCEGDASCAGFAGRAWACWFVAGACCFGPRGANAHLSGASGQEVEAVLAARSRVAKILGPVLPGGACSKWHGRRAS